MGRKEEEEEVEEEEEAKLSELKYIKSISSNILDEETLFLGIFRYSQVNVR